MRATNSSHPGTFKDDEMVTVSAALQLWNSTTVEKKAEAYPTTTTMTTKKDRTRIQPAMLLWSASALETKRTADDIRTAARILTLNIKGESSIETITDNLAQDVKKEPIGIDYLISTAMEATNQLYGGSLNPFSDIGITNFNPSSSRFFRNLDDHLKSLKMKMTASERVAMEATTIMTAIISTRQALLLAKPDSPRINAQITIPTTARLNIPPRFFRPKNHVSSLEFKALMELQNTHPDISTKHLIINDKSRETKFNRLTEPRYSSTNQRRY